MLKQKNERLATTFDLLLNKSPSDKPELFQLLFKKSYHPNKDYLLRNVLRDLNNEIRLFVAQEALLSVLAKDDALSTYWFLKSLIQRKAFDQFDAEWRKAWRKAETKSDFKLIVELVRLRFEFIVYEKKVDLDYFMRMEWLFAAALEANYLNYLELEFDLKRNLIFTKDYISRKQKEFKTHSAETVFEMELVVQPPFFAFYDYLFQSYSVKGTDKIGVLTNALDLLPEILKQRPKLVTYEVTLRAMIGLEYYLLRDFEQANQFNRSALDQLRKHKQYFAKNASYNFHGMIFNQISNLINLDKYEEAISLFWEFERDFDKDCHFWFRINWMVCMAYVFTGNYKKAYELMSLDLTHCAKFDEHTLRLVYIIICYHQDNLNLAISETDALRKAIKNDRTSFLHYRDLIGLFMKYFNRVAGRPDDKRRLKAIATLKADAEALSGEYLLFKKWLLQRVD
ncbi:MAG: hypothetical protein AAF502_08940 [Bacteroidota bacterium]